MVSNDVSVFPAGASLFHCRALNNSIAIFNVNLPAPFAVPFATDAST